MAVSIVVPVAPAVSQTHYIYVRKGGSDMTGDGTLTKPFLTVTKALTMVVSPASGFRWIIDVGAGNFTETSPLLIKPYTYIVGNGISSSGPTRLITTTIGLDSTAINATSRCGFKNLYLNADLTINVSSNAGFSRVVEMVEVGVTNNFSFIGGSNADFLDWMGGRVFGTSVITDCNAQIGNVIFVGATTIGTSTQNSSAAFLGCSFGGLVTATSTPTFTNGASFVACSVSTLTVNASGTTVSADATSIPLAANVTITNSGTLTRLTDAASIHFTPDTSGDWVSPAPTQIASALDNLAALTVTIKQADGLPVICGIVRSTVDETASSTSSTPISNWTWGTDELPARSFKFQARMNITADALGGYKIGFAATNLIFFRYTAKVFSVSGGTLEQVVSGTSTSDVISGLGDAEYYMELDGALDTSSGNEFALTLAKSVAAGGDTTLLEGSSIQLTLIP